VREATPLRLRRDIAPETFLGVYLCLLVATCECFEGDPAPLDRAILVDGRSTWEMMAIEGS
jgi:hypothetical protein